MKYLSFLLLTLSLLLAACKPTVTEPAAAGQPGLDNDNDVNRGALDVAVKSTIPKTNPAAPEDMGSAANEPSANKPNVIRWSTASEHDSFGYDIYRGRSQDGPFSVINDDIIPGAGTTDMPNRYEFIDDATEPGTSYWYYIESISLTGERKRITPVYPAKRKPENISQP